MTIQLMLQQHRLGVAAFQDDVFEGGITELHGTCEELIRG